METNLPSCFLIQFLEQLLKFLLNFTLLKYVSEKLWLFNHKRADFWLPNFGFERSLLSLLKILEFKRLFPLIYFARYWGQSGEISLFSLLVFFCTQEQFTISMKYSRNRTYSCTLATLYINSRSYTYKLYP